MDSPCSYGIGCARLKTVDRSKGRKALARRKVLEYLGQLPPCLIGVEACAGAHYCARELTKLGHTVKLMAAQFVIPHRKSGKTTPTTPRRSPRPWDDPISLRGGEDRGATSGSDDAPCATSIALR